MYALVTLAAIAESEAETSSSDETAAPASADAYRIERLAWFAVVAVLVITEALPDWLALHQGVAPLAAGLVFLVAGVMLRRRAGIMRPAHWLAGALLLATAGFNFFSRPDLDLSIVAVVGAAFMIAHSIFARNADAG